MPFCPICGREPKFCAWYMPEELCFFCPRCNKWVQVSLWGNLGTKETTPKTIEAEFKKPSLSDKDIDKLLSSVESVSEAGSFQVM